MACDNVHADRERSWPRGTGALVASAGPGSVPSVAGSGVPEAWRSPTPTRFSPALRNFQHPVAEQTGSGRSPDAWERSDARVAGLTVLGVAGLLGSIAAVAVATGASLLVVAIGLLIGAIISLGFGSIAAVTHGKQLVAARPGEKRSTGSAVAGFVMGWIGFALLVFDVVVFAALISLLGA